MQFTVTKPHHTIMLYVCLCATDGRELFIGKAVQKAYLEVTEEGAEGAVGSGEAHHTSHFKRETSDELLASDHMHHSSAFSF